MLFALGCAVFDVPCYGATVAEVEQDSDENHHRRLCYFVTQEFGGYAILDGGATKNVSGFMSFSTRGPRLTRRMLASRFLVARRKRQARTSEFPQGISVNVVSNESTPFLIGLDVIREYGLVIDYHYNRVCSHIMKRYLLCAILPTVWWWCGRDVAMVFLHTTARVHLIKVWQNTWEKDSRCPRKPSPDRHELVAELMQDPRSTGTLKDMRVFQTPPLTDLNMCPLSTQAWRWIRK